MQQVALQKEQVAGGDPVVHFGAPLAKTVSVLSNPFKTAHEILRSLFYVFHYVSKTK